MQHDADLYYFIISHFKKVTQKLAMSHLLIIYFMIIAKTHELADFSATGYGFILLAYTLHANYFTYSAPVIACQFIVV